MTDPQAVETVLRAVIKEPFGVHVRHDPVNDQIVQQVIVTHYAQKVLNPKFETLTTEGQATYLEADVLDIMSTLKRELETRIGEIDEILVAASRGV